MSKLEDDLFVFVIYFEWTQDFNLNKHKMALGVVLNPKSTAELEGIRDREADIIKERIQLILKAGANVILTTKGIDALCLKYCTSSYSITICLCLCN